MKTLRYTLCLCVFTGVAMVLPGRAIAEPVQLSLTVDANTTALYRFKEGTGTTSANEVSGAPTATLYGATWVPGRQFYAVATDSGYVSMNDSASALRPASAITVEVWAKVQRPSGYLACKNGSYFFTLGSTVNATFTLLNGASGSNAYVYGFRPVPIGQWTHFAMTYDSATKTGNIYINGVLDASTTFTQSPGTISGYGSKLLIAQTDWGTPLGSEFDGKIDSMRISNIARQFDPLYSQTPPPAPQGNLVANGDFEGGLNGWRINGTGDAKLIWETTGGAARGQKCLHTIPGANPAAGLLSRPIPATPGQHYLFSLQMKSSVNMWPRIEIDPVSTYYFVDSTHAVFPPVYDGTTTSWKQYNYSFTLPSNFSAPGMVIYIGYPSSGQLYVDDVRVLATDGPNTLTLCDEISVGPQTMPVGSVYLAGSPSPLTLTIANTDTADHIVTVQPTITDWEENRVSGVPGLAPSPCLPMARQRLRTTSIPAGGGPSASASILARKARTGISLPRSNTPWW